MFQGPPTEAVGLFASHGFPCPPLTNPADHVMDIITPRIQADGRVSSRLDLSTLVVARRVMMMCGRNPLGGRR